MNIYYKVGELEDAAYIAGFEEAKRLALHAVDNVDPDAYRDAGAVLRAVDYFLVCIKCPRELKGGES